MATPPNAVRAQLTLVAAAATADLAAIAAEAAPERVVTATMQALPLVVPAYYDAAGSLAVAWYDEIREESRPRTTYAPTIIGDPTTDWIEREVADFRRSLDADEALIARKLLEEASRLTEKEVARGFRDSITGNTRMDEDAIGWSRVARAGACKFCVMVASRGAVFRESTATFSAHKNCHCAARPEFRNGEHGPEATAEQYLAAQSDRTPAQRARLREYLNANYPNAPG